MSPETAARVSMGLDGVLSASALGGGTYMVVHPRTMLSVDLLAGSPFDTWFVPGLALIAVNGVLPLCALVLTWRGHRLAPPVQCAVGLGLLGWLMIQIPLVGYATMFQVPYSVLAVGLLALNIGPAAALRAGR